MLQELVRRAPSTYNHSITVGSIAEAAADTIGRGTAGPRGRLLPRHRQDAQAGVLRREPVGAGSRHESLIPAMSTLVIVAHIKDGADLARQHKLPQPIIDFIEQHQARRWSTTSTAWPASRARPSQRRRGRGEQFPLSGPRPQTKEAAVLMLADSAQSACRSLRDPAPSRIESLVREIAERQLDDGQFDESNLTLRELRTIERSIVKSLIANYHGRVKYPTRKPLDDHHRRCQRAIHLPVDDGRLRRAVRMILQVPPFAGLASAWPWSMTPPSIVSTAATSIRIAPRRIELQPGRLGRHSRAR